MKWKKLGRIYVATGQHGWDQSRAYVPNPMIRPDGNVRVYLSFLDAGLVGRAGYVDLDRANIMNVIGVSQTPVLDIGEDGTFDDNGVTPCCIVETPDAQYMYYVGWQLGIKVRYHTFNGLAISHDGGETFQRHWRVPVTERSHEEWVNRSSPFVLIENGVWKMWYAAGFQWVENAGKITHSYNLRYIESPDGVHWPPVGEVCLDFESEDEFGFGRPWIIREGNRYRMWISVRTFSKGYRLGYAESTDGIHWERDDASVGIDVSPDGWDSQMQCMPAVFSVDGKTYLLYNGNNYGETGFGAAVLEED